MLLRVGVRMERASHRYPDDKSFFFFFFLFFFFFIVSNFNILKTLTRLVHAGLKNNLKQE